MKKLENYGWNSFYKSFTSISINQNFEIGRVISIMGFKFTLITNDGELESELSGKLLFGSENENLPKVGDWVYFIRYDTIGYIIEILPRLNELYRKTPGNKTEKQILAANIDYAIIVQGLDRDFNLMRLDRYLVQMAICNIIPIVILNKIDLVDDPKFYLNEVEKLGRECSIVLCSTYNNAGIDNLIDGILEKGKTYILVGSSGVGKSSILNAILKADERKIGSVSNATNKGKHITTTRDLYELPNGSLLIDTPGMKEFGIASDDDDHSTAGLFPLIDKYASNCKFNDCMHVEEDGCAVIDAYKAGDIEPEVYHSYIKLLKEKKHFETSIEDQKRMGKRFGKMVREAKEYRKKYKY